MPRNYAAPRFSPSAYPLERALPIAELQARLAQIEHQHAPEQALPAICEGAELMLGAVWQQAIPYSQTPASLRALCEALRERELIPARLGASVLTLDSLQRLQTSGEHFTKQDVQAALGALLVLVHWYVDNYSLPQS
ncbi:MAG: hypothetical protein ACO1RX_12250 [Candidatus Sericytochromatia bacterium]